jgi:chromosome segregation ATPase
LSIDLDSTEGRKQYLSEKLDDLLEGINDSYGTLLMEELLARLELTVKDFNDEMKVLCDQLVTKEKERQQLMEMLKTTDGLPVPDSGGAPVTQDASQSVETAFVETEELGEDVPEWEKKLAKLEKK